MEVKLEAQAGLELGNALCPSFQDISGQGWLQEGTGWEGSPAVAHWFPLCAKSRLLLDLYRLLPTTLAVPQLPADVSVTAFAVPPGLFLFGTIGRKSPCRTNLLLIIAVFLPFLLTDESLSHPEPLLGKPGLSPQKGGV